MRSHIEGNITRRSRQRVAAAAGTAAIIALSAARPALADGPSVSVGAGLRTSFTSTDVSGTKDNVNDFALDSARIYLSGKVTDQISFMFNTEYDGEQVKPIDAVAQFSLSDQVNIWAGRFLPPSDRSNMYGPYYANDWGVYNDGVQDGYPSVTTGRDDGIMYWGQFGIAKVSAGAFDVPSTKGTKDVLYAGRVQLDFWDPEGGYYLNGTYYGEKDLLAVGVAAQTAKSDNAYSVDFLFEKKLANLGAVSVEAEYAKYDGLGGYTGKESDGYYGLVAYLFPTPVGIGKVQLLGKYGEAKFKFATGPDAKQKTTELNVNYLIKTFNARVSLFYIDKSFDQRLTDQKQVGLGLQVQM
jgi:hypothetical protein